MQRASTPWPMQSELTDASILSNEPVAAVKALAAPTTFPLFFTSTATSAFSSLTLFPRQRFSPWADEHVCLFLVSSFCSSSSWSLAVSCFSIFPPWSGARPAEPWAGLRDQQCQVGLARLVCLQGPWWEGVRLLRPASAAVFGMASSPASFFTWLVSLAFWGMLTWGPFQFLRFLHIAGRGLRLLPWLQRLSRLAALLAGFHLPSHQHAFHLVQQGRVFQQEGCADVWSQHDGGVEGFPRVSLSHMTSSCVPPGKILIASSAIVRCRDTQMMADDVVLHEPLWLFRLTSLTAVVHLSPSEF